MDDMGDDDTDDDIGTRTDELVRFEIKPGRMDEAADGDDLAAEAQIDSHRSLKTSIVRDETMMSKRSRQLSAPQARKKAE